MRLGILDVGSNTVHLVVVEAAPGARPTPSGSHKTSLRLMRFIGEDGTLSQAGVDALCEAIGGAAELSRADGVEIMLPMATSAVRDAANSEAVLAAVRERTGIALRVLTGAEEARLTFLAIRRWFGWSAGSLLMFDIGGGSLEIAVGGNEYPDVAVSVPLGAARQTHAFLRHDPPEPAEVTALRKSARRTLRKAAEAFAGLPDPDLAIGSSKTIRSLAQLAGADRQIGSQTVTKLRRSGLGKWLPMLTELPADALERLPGVTGDRSAQIAAGAVVLHEAMRVFGVRSLVTSPWALREGLVLRYLDSLPGDADDLTQQRLPDPRH